MSLDISFIQEGKEVDSYNITHNLTDMAGALGVYHLLWHSEQFSDLIAKDAVDKINWAINELSFYPEKYKQYEAENKWGTVEQFKDFLVDVCAACREHPNAGLISDR